MKHVNIPLEDSEFEALLTYKGRRSWHDILVGVLHTPEKSVQVPKVAKKPDLVVLKPVEKPVEKPVKVVLPLVEDKSKKSALELADELLRRNL